MLQVEINFGASEFKHPPTSLNANSAKPANSAKAKHLLTLIANDQIFLRSSDFDDDETDSDDNASTDDHRAGWAQMDEDLEFDVETMVQQCNQCRRNILGFLYECDNEIRCSSCFHEIKGGRGDVFTRMRFPGDKRQRNTAVIGFSKESPAKMNMLGSSHDFKKEWCINKKDAGKLIPNYFDLRFPYSEDREMFTAITTKCFSIMRQNQDSIPHGFFEVSLKLFKDPKLSIGFSGERTRRKGLKDKSVSPTWGWTYTSDQDRCYETDTSEDSVRMLMSGWKEGDKIGILCNFRDSLFSFYKNGIKDVRGDIRWTGRFDMFPLVEASNCNVEICYDYELCQFKPLEFSVLPKKPIPYEIFEWKRPCVCCKCRLATHMYMCAGADSACQTFIVCSVCFHSGKEIQCPHEKCTHWHSEKVAFYDTGDKGENVCKNCKQPSLKHSMQDGKHKCPQISSAEMVDSVWTFQSPKVPFGQHESHLFRRICIPSEILEMDDIASSQLPVVERNLCKPLFGELVSSPFDPTSELRGTLLCEDFEEDSFSRKQTGVVVAVDNLCDFGCSSKHSGYCVHCSKHFSFHRFGRLCQDDELSLDFGTNNDSCSRCSLSVEEHRLVHLCLDDSIGRFHKHPLEQHIFLAMEDKMHVEKISQISRLIPDPGPHHHRQGTLFFVVIL
jgi:hypothetical protein